MARPIWNGTISFGLLNIPLQLYSGERSLDLHFHAEGSRDGLARLRKIIDTEVARQSGKKVKTAKVRDVESPDATTNVVDFRSLLKRSLEKKSDQASAIFAGQLATPFGTTA